MFASAGGHFGGPEQTTTYVLGHVFERRGCGGFATDDARNSLMCGSAPPADG